MNIGGLTLVLTCNGHRLLAFCLVVSMGNYVGQPKKEREQIVVLAAGEDDGADWDTASSLGHAR